MTNDDVYQVISHVDSEFVIMDTMNRTWMMTEHFAIGCRKTRPQLITY